VSAPTTNTTTTTTPTTTTTTTTTTTPSTTTTTPTTTTTTTANNNNSAMPERKNVPCRYFLSNSCRFGAQCAFSHDAALVAAAAASSTTSTTASTTSTAAPAAAPVSLHVPVFAPIAAAGMSVANSSSNSNSNGVVHSAAAPTHAAPVLIALQPGVPVFSIDVECVATGTQHNSRATGQIALVDQFEEPILNLCNARANFFIFYFFAFYFFIFWFGWLFCCVGSFSSAIFNCI
jgi:hypothetical protein